MAEAPKPGLGPLKSSRSVPPKPGVPKDDGSVNLDSGVKLSNNGSEDKILQAIKTHDLEWLRKHADVGQISAAKADIFLTTAIRLNSLDTLEALLKSGFLPMQGGSSEKAALSKGSDWVDLMSRFAGREIVALAQQPTAPVAVAKTETSAGMVGMPSKAGQQSSDAGFAAGLALKEMQEKIDRLSAELAEKSAGLADLEAESIALKMQQEELQEHLLGMEKALDETESALAQKTQEVENLHIEMDLHKSGRVKFQFDPHEPADFDEQLREALLTTTGKAVQTALADGSLDTLRTKISRIRPSKRTLGPLFTWACEKGNLELAQVLLRCGAPIDFSENLPMTRACKTWKPDLVFWLARSGADWHFAGEYPLRCAARHGDHKACVGLWRMGASINARDGAALMEALRMGHIDTVTTLISLGINVYKNNDEIIEELSDIPEVVEHIAKVREMEKTAIAMDPLILERVASKLGKDWVSRRGS